MDDDVSAYTEHLTELERHLFRAGASGMGAHDQWIQFGRSCRYSGRTRNSRRRDAADAVIAKHKRAVEDGTRTITPDREIGEPEGKRQRQSAF
jgi:hypothetical protein